MMYQVDRELFEAALESFDPSHGLEIEAAYPERRVFRTDCIAVTGIFPGLAMFLFELGRLAEQGDNDVLEDLVADTQWDTFGTELVLYFPGWVFETTPPA
ncbi:hypothetical protein [Glycomyces sp. NPDC047010]|uniref:hypothetical protein n=1 Tax=Glycomyces sp. NPDC047010 TaxID=3155023 RepID=UPI0033C3DBEE